MPLKSFFITSYFLFISLVNPCMTWRNCQRFYILKLFAAWSSYAKVNGTCCALPYIVVSINHLSQYGIRPAEFEVKICCAIFWQLVQGVWNCKDIEKWKRTFDWTKWKIIQYQAIVNVKLIIKDCEAIKTLEKQTFINFIQDSKHNHTIYLFNINLGNNRINTKTALWRGLVINWLPLVKILSFFALMA